MYELLFHRDAEKIYRKAEPELARRLDACFEQIQKNPLQYPQSIALKGKLEGLYRRRVGDWRIIYEVDTNQRIVYILQIVHRGKAYR